MIHIFNQSNMDNFDTLQKARRDLAGEIDAVINYDEHIHNTNNTSAKQTWMNIRNEELVHTGELLALIQHLDPTQRQYIEQGMREFNERMK